MEGRIDIAVVSLATVLVPIPSGKVKALTVMSPQRAPAPPEVPSLAEAGYGDVARVVRTEGDACRATPADRG